MFPDVAVIVWNAVTDGEDMFVSSVAGFEYYPAGWGRVRATVIIFIIQEGLWYISYSSTSLQLITA